MPERRVRSDHGADPRETAALLHRVRPLTGKPLIVKLTPNASDVPAVARAAEESGASAVSLINTIRGMALDPETGEPWLGGVTGGVSGPAVRAVALAQVYSVAAAVAIPVVGMGGVQRGRDALDLLRAGATLVAVGTESFRDPAAGARVATSSPRSVPAGRSRKQRKFRACCQPHIKPPAKQGYSRNHPRYTWTSG